MPGGSSPSLIAVPSRSTVSSNAVCERTGANTVSSEATDSSDGDGRRESSDLAHSRSNPRKRSQSVTAASNAASSTSAALA